MVIKFGDLSPNEVYNTIRGLKFSGMVQYRHTYMHMDKKLTDFNLVV